MLHGKRAFTLAGAALVALAPALASAQQMAYADLDGPSGDAVAVSDGDGGDAAASSDATSDKGGRGHRATSSSGVRTRIAPYLEVDQAVFANLTGTHDVLTYTTLAAGVDADIRGRNTQGAVSVRYERRISESRSKLGDADIVSGVARVHHDLVPRTLAIEAGGLATRTRVDPSGSSALNVQASDAVSQTYSVYAGPALSTQVGEAAVNASYLAGYTRVGATTGATPVTGGPQAQVFDHSIHQAANLTVATKANAPFPVGLGVTGGYYREDISNLDQRVEDYHALGEVAVPLGYDLEVVGGAGYEVVRVSARDAVRDATGTPVLDKNGRYVTDKSAPRRLAYNTTGVIWEAGILWKPSRRTSLSAYVGRRYGDTTYWGSFNYAPSDRSVLNVSVYQGLTGFGGSVENALASLPTDIAIGRDPFNGGLAGCATGATSGGCLNNALSTVNGAAFRTTGVSAVYGRRIGRMQATLGGGYSRRKYIGASGTALASVDGIVDQTYYFDATLSGALDRVSRFSASLYANWFDSGFGPQGDSRTIGANATYFRTISGHLSGTASVSVDGIDRKTVDDEYIAAALVGLRYNF